MHIRKRILKRCSAVCCNLDLGGIFLAEGFKSRLMGFDKQEVLDYIEQLAAGYAKELAEKDEEINSLREKNRELKKKLKELRLQ